MSLAGNTSHGLSSESMSHASLNIALESYGKDSQDAPTEEASLNNQVHRESTPNSGQYEKGPRLHIQCLSEHDMKLPTMVREQPE